MCYSNSMTTNTIQISDLPNEKARIVYRNFETTVGDYRSEAEFYEKYLLPNSEVVYKAAVQAATGDYVNFRLSEDLPIPTGGVKSARILTIGKLTRARYIEAYAIGTCIQAHNITVKMVPLEVAKQPVAEQVQDCADAAARLTQPRGPGSSAEAGWPGRLVEPVTEPRGLSQ